MSRDEPTVVLLLDQHADSREMYTEYLQACGFRVIAVAQAEDALARASEAGVVVTGIRVSGVCDGLEVIRRLRRESHTRTTPIIVMTACVFQADRDRAFVAGGNAFLPKPCLPDHLASEIRRVLKLRHVPKARPAQARQARASEIVGDMPRSHSAKP